MGGAAPAGGDGIAEDPLPLLAELVAARTPCVLATVVAVRPPASARPGDKAVITADGRLRGWIGGSCSEPVVRREALSALADGTPRLVRIVSGDGPHEARRPGELTLATTCPSGGSLEVFVEPRLPRPLLVVFGASPAAGILAEMGALAGFRTCAVHPGVRPGELRADLVLSSLDLAAAGAGPDSWAVVATMGHYDEDALEAALACPAVQVSLVASERRATAVLDVLRSRGLDEATLARVRAPAGRVRAGTQAEIALFALAELVETRRERTRGEADHASARIFAVDPVCGMTVDVTGPARRTAGAAGPVYFCGPGCQEQFERDPERYAS